MKFLYKLSIHKLLAISFLLLAFCLNSCKKFVQIEPPTTQLVTASVFNNSATATAAQLAIYNKMFKESWYMAQAGGLLGDELTNYSTQPLQVQYYTNAMTASNNPAPGPWTTAYPFYIYPANAIIEGLQNNNAIPPVIVGQLTGESKFVRAYWYFYLTNLYGDVPLVTTTDYRTNGSIARTPQAKIYQQIIADLKDAQNLLSTNYVDATDTAITTERVRPNKVAASALLARVYLYTQKYDSAEAQASLVINNSMYSLCSNLSGANSVFLKNSTEAIWQLQTPVPASYNTEDCYEFYLPSAPAAGGGNSATISSQLLNSFEMGDKRLAQWVGVYTTTSTPAVNYYFPYKYHSYNISATNTSGITEYTMMLRLAEQYLIRAEARAQQGNTTGALSDLNTIRNRAGLANYSGAIDKAPLLAAILHERQVELFTEWGHRWLDLIRTGNINSVMGSPGNVYNAKGGVSSWNPTLQFFPIPQTERNSDANLTQNTGY